MSYVAGAVVSVPSLLFWLWGLSAGVFCAPAIARLGADSFAARESAADSLSSPAAYPALVRAAESHTDPEVRSAARRLATPTAARLADLRCLWLLIGPEPEPRGFRADHATRYRLAWWCGRLGIGSRRDRKRLRPENDPGTFDRWASISLARIRGTLRGHDPD